MKTTLKVLVLTPLLFISSCTNSGNPVGPSTTTPGTGKIFTGPSVDVGSQTIGTSGGTFTVNKPGDPLNGFQITVPANGLAQAQTFAVSYAPITSHQLGSLINPVSPLITITCGGGYSADEMKVKVPIKLPAGCFAMGFFYDETTGIIEPLPVAGLDSSSVTIATRHLSPSDVQLGKGLRKSANLASGTIFISYILLSVLGSQTVISSGFTPGVDDWEFINHGSYIAPGGHCAGQSSTAIWYYYEKKLKGGPGLFHQYDKITDPLRPDSLWCDNPYGYRFASTIQADMNWDNWIRDMKVESWVPDVVFDAFVYSMLVTGKAQMAVVRSSSGKGGHALVVYKIDVLGGRLYVADPNYPNNRNPQSGTPVVRAIDYVPGIITGNFKPFSSAAKAGDPEIIFDQIGYAAVTSHIDWGKIAQRWTEFQSGTIGNDRFPAYTLYEDHTGAQFADGLDTDLDSIKISCVCLTCPFSESGTYHGQVVNGYDSLGKLLGSTTGGHLTLALRPGDNTFGLYIMGTPADGKDHYVDFKWMKVHRHMTLTIASTETNGAPVSTYGVKNQPYKFIAKSAKPVPNDGKVRYDWSFGDRTAVTSVNNDSTVTHTFANGGTDTVSVAFYYNGTRITQVSATATIASSIPKVDSVRVNPDGLYPGVPALTWGLPGWRLDIYGQDFMTGATDTPTVWLGLNKVPVVYSTSKEADAIIPTMPTGTNAVWVTRKDGVESDTKSIFIGIPQSDIDLHSNASLQFTFYYTYYNAVMGRVDTMGITQAGIYGTVAWTANGFTITKTPVPTVDFPEYGTAAVTFSQGEANVDLKWYVLDRYRGYTPDDSIHYSAQHVRARGGWIQAFPPLAFSADTPEEMKRVTTQLSGIVVSRQGAHGQPVTGLVPAGSSFSITLPGITH